jgi:Ca2+-binding EF-hand superfamily protein
MREALFSVFRAVDQQDLGVVSFNECVEVFKNMDLDLTQD